MRQETGLPARRRTALVLGLVVALAFAARAWRPAALGLGHYDEGVYAISASGALDPADPHLFPGQARFSPPLWFTSVAVASRVAGTPAGATALWVNVVVGTLTVLAAGLVGWAWFGPAAGAATAMLLAGSQFQIMLARTALTDPAFTLLMLVAVAVLGRGLARESLAWSAAGGVLTGLAWNAKYHGWFVLVITAGAIAASWFMHRRDPDARGKAIRALKRWTVASSIAAAMYAPWALYMRESAGGGGWRGIFQYYLGMLGTEWLPNAGRHAAQQAFLEGPLSRAAVIAAAAVATALAARPVGASRVLALGAGLAVTAWAIGGAGATVLLAACGAAWLGRRGFGLEVLCLFAWVALWFVAAPIYRPYARLLLPLGVALALLAGAGLAGLMRWAAGYQAGRRAVSPRAAGTALALAALVFWFGSGRLRPPSGDPWHDGTGTLRAADSVAALVPARAAIIVVGEPSLAYYLMERGRRARPLNAPAELDSLSEGTYLVTGVYADRAPPLRERIATLMPRLKELARLDLAPSDLRLLDDMTPAQARHYRIEPDTTFVLHLFRLEPSAGGGP